MAKEGLKASIVSQKISIVAYKATEESKQRWVLKVDSAYNGLPIEDNIEIIGRAFFGGLSRLDEKTARAVFERARTGKTQEELDKEAKKVKRIKKVQEAQEV